MKYRVVHRLLHNAGMPSTPRGTNGPFRAVACHDTEGLPGVAGVDATIKFMIESAARRNASYHEFWAWDPNDESFTVIVVLPPDRAAHSVAPQPDKYDPHQTVRVALGDGVADPNMWVYAVSIAGRVAQVNTWATHPGFIEGCRRRFRELNESLGVSWRLEHFRFNPATRTDWGTKLTAALGGVRIEADMLNDYLKDLDISIAGATVTIRKGATARTLPQFNPADYLDYAAAAAHGADIQRTALGWVPGSQIVLANGTIYDSRRRWIATNSVANGLVFYHEGDVLQMKLPGGGFTQADVSAAQEQGEAAGWKSGYEAGADAAAGAAQKVASASAPPKT